MSSQHRATPADWAVHQESPHDSDSSCILELRDRVEALEALEAAALGRHGESADSADVLSLVGRVTNAIYDASHTSNAEARAAIREVAAWLRSEYPNGTAWANLIEEEANR